MIHVFILERKLQISKYLWIEELFSFYFCGSLRMPNQFWPGKLIDIFRYICGGKRQPDINFMLFCSTDVSQRLAVVEIAWKQGVALKLS